MNLKHAWQRLTRGYDDTITWDLYQNIAAFVLPRLIAFRATTTCCPHGMTLSKWYKELDCMINAFRLVLSQYDGITTTATTCEDINKGLALFAKRYLNLWN